MQSTRKRPRLSFLDCGEGEGEEGREDSEGSTRDLDKDSWPLSDSKNVRGGSTADEGNSPAPLDLFSTYSFAGVGEDEKVPSSAAELGRRQDREARAEAACFQASSKNCVEDLLFGSTADGTRTSSARGEASLEADAAGFSFETDAALIDSLLAGSCEDELLPKDTHDQSLSSSSSSGTSSSSAPNSVGSAAHRPYRSPSSALLQSPSTRPPGESASARAAIGDCVAGDARNSGSYSLPGENEAAESSLVSTLARRSASDICAQEEVLVADDSSSLFCPPTMPEIQNVVASAHMSWRADGVDMWTGPDTNSRLDLRLLAISCRFAEYNPRKINACILRLRAPKCTALVFRSGKFLRHSRIRSRCSPSWHPQVASSSQPHPTKTSSLADQGTIALSAKPCSFCMRRSAPPYFVTWGTTRASGHLRQERRGHCRCPRPKSLVGRGVLGHSASAQGIPLGSVLPHF